MALPSITVTFRERAESAVVRSASGILCLVVPETSQTEDYKTYRFNSAAEVEASSLTSTNKAYISRAFVGRIPRQVVVVTTKAASLSSTTVAAALDDVAFGWVCSNGSGNQSVLAAYAAAQTSRAIKACVVGVTSSSDHVLNLADQTVTLKAGGTAVMLAYASRIAAVCAACPITESITYTALDEISAVTGTIGTNQTGVFKDDNILRISKGVMASGDKTAIVEAKDLIREDVVNTFKNYYLGRMRNSADNQALYCSAVLGYLKDLAAQSVINPDGEISVEIDTDAMRSAWAADGVDVTGLTDAQVRQRPYKSNVYVKATCGILDAIEDLSFTVELE